MVVGDCCLPVCLMNTMMPGNAACGTSLAHFFESVI